MSEDPYFGKSDGRPIVSDSAVQMICLCVFGSIVAIGIFAIAILIPAHAIDILGGAGFTIVAIVILPALFKAMS